MKEKILVLAITIISVLSALVSCSQVPNEELPIETTVTPETTEAIPDDPVINSFYADYVNFSFHPEDDYAYLIALSGTEEREKWERIYVDPEKNEDILIYYEEGEVYEVFYFGEITTMEDGYGYIEQLHSFRIASSPREYGGIDYSVSILRQGFNKNAIRSVSLNSQWKTTDMLMLLAESREEFTEMATDYFMSDMEIPQNATDLQRKTITYRNQRRQLLDGYNEDFFKNNDLLMIFNETGSGSERYDIIDVTSQDSTLTINIAMTRGSGTCNMAYWIYFISIPKNITAVTTEYKNACTNLVFYSKSIRYGYLATDIRTKALNYTAEDQPYYTPWIFKAESDDDLKAIFELIRNPTGIGAFDDDDAKKAYDTLFDNVGKGYFESNALIVIYRAASSSGDTFKVSSITTAGDTLTVGITQTEQGVTEDMSGWLFVVPVHKTALQNITTYTAE